LAKEEGLFAEPASAASIAGIIKQRKTGEIPAGSTIVAVLTGNGLKDPETAIQRIQKKPVVLPNEEKAVFEYIEGVVHA
jgi:threonine synthase